MQQSYDDQILKVSGETYEQNVYLLGMYLRDANNILHSLKPNPGISKSDLLGEAVILFASAGLEGNLSYFATLALAISDAASDRVFKDPELEYLKATQMEFSRNAELVTKKQKQTLKERLLIVPKLLGRALGREFQMPSGEQIALRLYNALDRRDAIVHPRWNAYPQTGIEDAVDSFYAVLEYIDSVREQFFPYMIGYIGLLSQYGAIVSDHPTEPPPLQFRVLGELKDLTDALASSWFNAQIMYDAAMAHPTEGDSNGSMFTRTALVALYSMVIAQLSLLGRLAELTSAAFDEKEINFFNEREYGLDDSGNAVLKDSKQRFEDRATIMPALISKKTCPNPLTFNNRGETWFQNMFKKYFDMRNAVMHSSFGESTPRVSKAELKDAFAAVHHYFAFVATAGGPLGLYNGLLKSSASRGTH